MFRERNDLLGFSSQLSRSSGTSLNSDQLKEKVMCWIVDSISITNVEQRIEFIYNKLKIVFPSDNINLFLFEVNRPETYYLTDTRMGTAYFDREQYGQGVLLVLLWWISRNNLKICELSFDSNIETTNSAVDDLFLYLISRSFLFCGRIYRRGIAKKKLWTREPIGLPKNYCEN